MPFWSRKKTAEAAPAEQHDLAPAAPEMGAALIALVARWDAFIGHLLHRADGVVSQAVADSAPLITGSVQEWVLLGRQWTRAQAELHRLFEELSDGWDRSSDALSDLSPPEGVMQRQGQRRDETHCELEIRYQRGYRATMARAADLLRRCGEQRLFAASGALFLGQHEGLRHWEALTRAETAMRAYRDPKDVPLALLERFEADTRQYWATVYATEAHYVPELKPYVEAKLDRVMKDAGRTLSRYWQWRLRTG